MRNIDSKATKEGKSWNILVKINLKTIFCELEMKENLILKINRKLYSFESIFSESLYVHYSNSKSKYLDKNRNWWFKPLPNNCFEFITWISIIFQYSVCVWFAEVEFFFIFHFPTIFQWSACHCQWFLSFFYIFIVWMREGIWIFM